MSAIEKIKNYSPPTAGLNTRFNPITISALEANTLTNFQINNSGVLETYPGYLLESSPFPSSSDSFIRAIFNLRRGATFNQLLVAASDAGNTNSTYKVDIKFSIGDGTYSYISHNVGTAAFTNGNTTVTGTNTSWTSELKAGDKIKLASDPDADYTEIATVVSDTSLTLISGYLGTSHSAAAYKARKIWNNNDVINMVAFNNVAILADGDGIPQQYDGTSTNNLINTYAGTVLTQGPHAAPKGPFLSNHKNRLFLCDTNGNLSWSHANDQTYYDPASTEPVYTQDGGDVVAIISFADSIFVFKNNGKIYRVIGNFDDSAAGTAAYILKVDYSENIGKIAGRSVFIHNNLLYFLAETGVYSIDFRGYIQKISYVVDPTTNVFSFSNASQIAKSYPFTNKAQFDTGTHNGTLARSDQLLRSYFDDLRQTDAYVYPNSCSIAIGTDNTIHVAYIQNSDHNNIQYVRYYPDNTVTKEKVLGTDASSQIVCLSIAVSAADQTVGIAYGINGSSTTYFVERTPDNPLWPSSPVTVGTWGGAVAITGADLIGVVHALYSAGGVPYIAVIQTDTGANSLAVIFMYRAAGVWHRVVVESISGSVPANDIGVVFAIAGNGDFWISTTYANSDIRAFKSTNSGVTWSRIEIFTTTLQLRAMLSAGFNHAGNFITGFTDGSGNLKKRNHSTTSTSTLLSGIDYSIGWFSQYNSIISVPADKDYFDVIIGTPGSQSERVYFETSSFVGPSSTPVIQNDSLNYKTSPMSFINNGYVTAMVAYGANANEVVIRRVSYYGDWVSPENHDSSLTAWGQYVTGAGTGGNSLEFQVAVASSSPANGFNDIVPGSIINSNPANIYVKARLIFSLLGWGPFTLSSLVLNYTGAGVDARQACGISFYNEAFFSASQSGQSNNNIILGQDIKNAFLTIGYPVNCFTKFNTSLYAGSSLQGDTYILKSGQTFNGSNYTSTFISKEDFLDNIAQEKDFFKIYVLYNVQNTGSFVFSYRLDNFLNSGNGTWTDTVVDQTKNGFQDILIGGKGRSIQFKITNSSGTPYISIIGTTLIYGMLNIR